MASFNQVTGSTVDATTRIHSEVDRCFTVGGDRPCEACDRMTREEDLIVMTSITGPISMAYCPDCVEVGAESASAMEILVEVVGGWDNLLTSYHKVQVYADGKYLPFDEYRSNK